MWGKYHIRGFIDGVMERKPMQIAHEFLVENSE